MRWNCSKRFFGRKVMTLYLEVVMSLFYSTQHYHRRDHSQTDIQRYRNTHNAAIKLVYTVFRKKNIHFSKTQCVSKTCHFIFDDNLRTIINLIIATRNPRIWIYSKIADVYVSVRINIIMKFSQKTQFWLDPYPSKEYGAWRLLNAFPHSPHNGWKQESIDSLVNNVIACNKSYYCSFPCWVWHK